MFRKAVAALIILAFAPVVSAQTMLDCSKLESEKDRLACYDEVAGRVEKKLEESHPGTTQERVEARNEVIAEAVVGEDSEERMPDLLKIEIQKVLRDDNRRVTYQSSDGRFFQRSTGSRITFKAGDICTIEEGVLGSLFLVRDDGSKNKVRELSVR